MDFTESGREAFEQIQRERGGRIILVRVERESNSWIFLIGWLAAFAAGAIAAILWSKI